MRYLPIFSLLLCLMISFSSYAQVPPKPKASAEAQQRAKDKAEYKIFKKQILGLKEFADEKRKAPKIQKEAKQPVKIEAVIDSVDDDQAKVITGYITQIVGDNTSNVYELTFDREQKKITIIKRTGDAIEPQEKADKEEKEPDAKKKVAPKKKTEDDDADMDEPEEKEKPAKKGKKDDDE